MKVTAITATMATMPATNQPGAAFAAHFDDALGRRNLGIDIGHGLLLEPKSLG
jgi:hypothetical protein